MENVKSSKKLTLLQNLENVTIKAEHVKGEMDQLNGKDRDVRAVSKFLEVTPVQAILFSVIFILNFKNRTVDFPDMAEFLKTNLIKVVHHLRELEALQRRQLICQTVDSRRLKAMDRLTIHDLGFYVNKNVLDSILENDKSLLHRKNDHTMITLLERIGKMIDDRDDGMEDYTDLVQETRHLIENNKEMEFVRRLSAFELGMNDQLVLLYVCRETINGNDGSDLGRTCEKIFEDVNDRYSMRKELVQGSSDLIRKDLLKLREGMFRYDREIVLTDRAMEDLFGSEKDLFIVSESAARDLVKSSSISEKDLYFNEEEKKQLIFLSDLLQEENHKEIIRRLGTKNLPCGINVLFYGEPGTGKTASVYEIARQTGRDLFVVDISNTKSMWFGESEKKIKELFDRYRKVVALEKKAPILLFNECDAVFSTRKEVGSSPVDQTENTIQNIILQELETLQGILIATTNLTKNLDPAFERRFLFKIAFKKPGVHSRRHIWMSKIESLKEEEAYALAINFDYSGGNIENVARKVHMHEILHGEVPEMARIVEFCEEEKVTKGNRRRIGFH
jgi:AAA+ superfamily predicted ATPase